MAEREGEGEGDSGSAAQDRRVRTGLRALIDEMMMQLRAVAMHDSWTQEERARAEADLARVMAQVRERAISGRNEDV
jgi:hypothetical protein